MRPVLSTVGHSNRTLAEFVALLKAHGIERLVDIRTVPKSRHVPWTSSGRLKRALARRGILYRHIPELGGLRRARRDSPNAAWRNASFRGYADYMLTDEFQAGVRKLEKLAAKRKTAVMCAEAVPWRCHRSLLADYWGVGGGQARHIMSPTNAREHRRTPFAAVRRGTLLYPPEKPTRRAGSTRPARSRRPSRSERRRPSRAGSASRSAP